MSYVKPLTAQSYFTQERELMLSRICKPIEGANVKVQGAINRGSFTNEGGASLPFLCTDQLPDRCNYAHFQVIQT